MVSLYPSLTYPIAFLYPVFVTTDARIIMLSSFSCTVSRSNARIFNASFFTSVGFKEMMFPVMSAFMLVFFFSKEVNSHVACGMSLSTRYLLQNGMSNSL